MRSIDPSFYYTKTWKQVRKTIWLKQHLLCNRCHRPVYVDGISQYIPKDKRLKGIVHHKQHLNNNNINNDTITLGEDNLEGLCFECHQKEHFSKNILRDGYEFDDDGNIKTT